MHYAAGSFKYGGGFWLIAEGKVSDCLDQLCHEGAAWALHSPIEAEPFIGLYFHKPLSGDRNGPMLGKTAREPQLKNIHLCLEDNPLRELVKALLREWGYCLTDNPAEARLLIITEGRDQPAGVDHRLTLSSCHTQGRKPLGAPLTIAALNLTLETHFHRTPRSHIRTQVDWPIRVTARGQRIDTHAVTIADRGIRFIFPFELAPNEEIDIYIEREDEIYDLQARVVYAMDRKEIGHGNEIEVGAVCTPQAKEVRDSIRSRIVGSYLKRVRPELGSKLLAEALQLLNVSRMSEISASSTSTD